MRRPRAASIGAVERIEVDSASPWWGEHRSRYQFAAKLCIGRSVLDVACGTGFGAQILADAGAAYVVGVDIAWDALAEAARALEGEAHLCRADAVRLPVRDGAFDVIVSFETIEHVADDVAFVGELGRVLKDGGWAIVSTPNALYTRRLKGPPNPFHVREYEPDELARLLGKSFARVELLGQTVHPRYPVCPFWQLDDELPPDPVGRMKVALWKAQNRLPFSVKDRMSRLLHNRAFYPGEYDFEFTPEAVERGHVLVAVCRP